MVRRVRASGLGNRVARFRGALQVRSAAREDRGVDRALARAEPTVNGARAGPVQWSGPFPVGPRTGPVQWSGPVGPAGRPRGRERAPWRAVHGRPWARRFRPLLDLRRSGPSGPIGPVGRGPAVDMSPLAGEGGPSLRGARASLAGARAVVAL